MCGGHHGPNLISPLYKVSLFPPPPLPPPGLGPGTPYSRDAGAEHPPTDRRQTQRTLNAMWTPLEYDIANSVYARLEPATMY